MTQIGFDEVQTLHQPPRDPRVGEAVMHPSSLSPHLHHVVSAKLGEMLGDPGLRDVQGSTQGLHVVLVISQLLDQADPIAMGQHSQKGGEFIYGEGAYGHGAIIPISPH